MLDSMYGRCVAAGRGKSLRETFGLITPSELRQLDSVAAAEEARRQERPSALEELSYWNERARFLAHLEQEAREKVREAAGHCTDAGVPEDEIRARISTRAPAGGAIGSSFGFAYFESGPDMDGDGDVDGGLFDSLGDLF